MSLNWNEIAVRESHPLRIKILRVMFEDQTLPASPKELAAATGEKIGNVSYHVRILREHGLIELVATEQRRGALEHFYRLAEIARTAGGVTA